MQRSTERMLLVFNAILVFALAFIVCRPGGLVRTTIGGWLARVHVRRTLDHVWATLPAHEGRLDAHGDSVMLLEFGDYQCPFCRRAYPSVDSMEGAHPGYGVAFIQFPLPIHPAAAGAARAAICADAQEHFREMSHELFATSEWMADTNWMREASRAGVPNLPRFAACLYSDSTTARLSREVALGRQLDVSGTPTFFGRDGVAEGNPGSVQLARMTSSP